MQHLIDAQHTGNRCYQSKGVRHGLTFQLQGENVPPSMQSKPSSNNGLKGTRSVMSHFMPICTIFHLVYNYSLWRSGNAFLFSVEERVSELHLSYFSSVIVVSSDHPGTTDVK